MLTECNDSGALAGCIECSFEHCHRCPDATAAVHYTQGAALTETFLVKRGRPLLHQDVISAH